MKKIKINKGFIVQKMGDKLTIFDGEESMLYTFNESASYIFSKLKLAWEKEKIVGSLVKRYKIQTKKAESDIEEFIIELKEKKIISA